MTSPYIRAVIKARRSFSSFKSSDPPQPGRGPVDFVGTGLTG
jgi:hypothetical protein